MLCCRRILLLLWGLWAFSPLSLAASGPEIGSQAMPEASWGRYVFGCIALGSLLLGPGLLWWGRRRGKAADLGWVPVPGILAAAGCGLVLWVSGAAKSAWAEWLMAGWGLVGAIGVFAGLWSAVRRRMWDAVGILGIYVIGVGIAQVLWLVPTPIATEIWPDTPLRGRMVASPPDHVIPFFTAAYMHHGKDGKESRKEYFGVEWAITSRGPLAPLVVNAGFTMVREHMHDPVAMPGKRRPADEEGFWVARVLGAGMNGLVVLGLVPLLAALGVDRGRRLVWGVALLTLTPLAVLHTGFLWPKLLASYFGCLALADALSGRSAWRIGLWLALAYLSHPLGGLLWPAVLVLAAWPAVRGAWVERRAASWWKAGLVSLRLLVALFLPLIPWIAYQRWINHPELLWNYPLGDGREWLMAESWGSWWMCRWHNICRSFVPLCFYFSDHARQYGNGVIEGWLRWAVQAQFSLPGAMGCGLYLVSLAALIRLKSVSGENATASSLSRSCAVASPCATGWGVVAGTIVVMLFYWGYGAGGLGRDCLQPVVVWILALTVAHPLMERRWLRYVLLGITAAEAGVVLAVGFLA